MHSKAINKIAWALVLGRWLFLRLVSARLVLKLNRSYEAEILHHKVELFGENERLAISVEPKFRLGVAQEVTEVNMEKRATSRQHEISRVTIAYAEDVSGDTLASERVSESLIVLVQTSLDN